MPAAAEISVGNGHACLRMVDGTVRCWGHNNRGQLGDGTTQDRAAPTVVPGLRDVVQIACGRDRSCALDRAGAVWCWGADRRQPERIAPLGPVARIAVGDAHECAAQRDGVVRCWGANGLGQLGDGTDVEQSRLPVTVAGITSAVDVAAAGQRSCAILRDHTVRCWGERGGMMDPAEAARFPNASSPVTVPVANVAELAMDPWNVCARITDGTVSCWGQMNSPDGNYSETPVPVRPALTTAIGLGDTSCAVRADHSVACWAHADAPTITEGPATQHLVGAQQLAFGGGNGCAVMTGGAVECWGSTEYLLPEPPGSPNASTPTPVPGLAHVEEIAAGRSHTCARLHDGSVQCWGENRFGQLGRGATSAAGDPTPRPVPGLSGVRRLVLGGDRSCAVLADASVRCWGEIRGLLGWGGSYLRDDGRPTPVGVPALAGALEIDLSPQWARLLHADGSTARLGPPQPLPFGNQVLHFVPASGCVINRDHTVSCLTRSRMSPVLVVAMNVPGLSHANAGAGRCVLTDDGRVRCVEWDANRPLGAHPVAGLTSVVDVVASTARYCARRSDNTVWCWPLREDGGAAAPAHVLDNVAQLVAGGDHLCARSVDGTVRCWGDGTEG
jgi:hypothetical protein